MTATTERKKIAAYLDNDLKEKAEKLAKIEKRSLSNLVEVLVQSAVDRAEGEGRL